MLALARIGVLVERGAVEVRQAVRVLGKVRRHPVDDHADARLVAAIDEVHEVLRRAEARRWARSSRSPGSPRSRENGCSMMGISSICV